MSARGPRTPGDLARPGTSHARGPRTPGDLARPGTSHARGDALGCPMPPLRGSSAGAHPPEPSSSARGAVRPGRRPPGAMPRAIPCRPFGARPPALTLLNRPRPPGRRPPGAMPRAIPCRPFGARPPALTLLNRPRPPGARPPGAMPRAIPCRPFGARPPALTLLNRPRPPGAPSARGDAPGYPMPPLRGSEMHADEGWRDAKIPVIFGIGGFPWS